MTPAQRDDLIATAKIVRSRAWTNDPLDRAELVQLAQMLMNIAEGRGALAGIQPAAASSDFPPAAA